MRFFVFNVLVIMVLCAFAQEVDTLSGVTIQESPIYEFSTGATIKSISMRDTDQSLSDALATQPSIYFKSYGNGQLSSIAFRGTSAGHTSVLWHGLPANYPTLGEMDFSQWPTWFVDEIDLQPGNAGALYGSGAIGGTVMLDSRISMHKNPSVAALRSEIGSFGYRFLGAKSDYKTGQWFGTTRAYAKSIANNFNYIHEGQKHRQEHASSLDYGFQQKLGYQGEKSQFLLDAMYTKNERQIQPIKGSEDIRNTLDSENLRLALVHSSEHSHACWSNTLSLLHFNTLFNDSLLTTSNQYAYLTSYSLEINEKISAQFGLNLNLFQARSDNYAGTEYDLQSAAFASVRWQVLERWRTSLNLRQSFYDKHKPFTPSLGSQIDLLENDKWKLTTNQQVSSGFRYPTLNMLHWSPGGNADLRSERSYSLEGGLELKGKTPSNQCNFSVQAYKSWTSDWIYWVSAGGISTPVNLRDVTVQGIEAGGQFTFGEGDVAHSLSVFYSFNQSLNQSPRYRDKQINYVPLHSGGITHQADYMQWRLNTSIQYTGERFTDLSNTDRFALGDFTLVDMDVQRTFNLVSLEMTTGFAVNNLFDIEYEYLRNRAMPGRNYQMNFSLKL